MSLPATNPTPAPPVLNYARPPRRRWWIIPAYACSAYPLLTLAMVYATAADASLSLGHWPRPFIDPAVTPLARLTLRMIGLIPTALALNAAVAAVGIIAAVVSNRRPPRWAVLTLVLPVLTCLLTLALAAWDPLDAVTWLLD